MSTRSIAIILAAGRGTRMRSTLPKVMHAVMGQPMIGHVVQLALDLRYVEIAVVVGHKKDVITAYLQEAFPEAPLRFYTQVHQNGTGDAVRCALPSYNEGNPHVAVLCGDVPNVPMDLLQRAHTLQRETRAPATVITATAPPGTSYGRIVRDDDDRVRAIVEFADADEATRRITEINTGTYVFDGQFLRQHIASLDANNAQGEFYLTDLIAEASTHAHPAIAIRAEDIGPLQGVNTRADLAAANAVARAGINQHWMNHGVTLIDPNTTWIDAYVTLETDVIIEPNVVICGHCHIATGAYLEAGVRIDNRDIGTGERVRAFVG